MHQVFHLHTSTIVYSHLVCILIFIMLVCVDFVGVTLGMYLLVWLKERKAKVWFLVIRYCFRIVCVNWDFTSSDIHPSCQSYGHNACQVLAGRAPHCKWCALAGALAYDFHLDSTRREMTLSSPAAKCIL